MSIFNFKRSPLPISCPVSANPPILTTYQLLQRILIIVIDLQNSVQTILGDDKRMSQALTDLQAEVAALNTSTSKELGAVAAAITAATAANNGSVSAADAEAIVAQLQAVQSKLDAETAVLTTPVDPTTTSTPSTPSDPSSPPTPSAS